VDRGIRAAKGEIVFVLNAIDLLPQDAGYFKLMLDHLKDPEVFSVAAVKQEEKESHGCGEIYFEKGFFLHRKGSPETEWGPSTRFANATLAQDKPSSKDVIYTAWADGGAEAIRKEYYLKIGGFDPLYKFYWEDVDLGWRAWKAGYKIIFEPEAVLIHKKEEGPIARFYTERQKRVMNLRNQLIFTWKNADFGHLLEYFLWEPYHLAVALKNGDQEWFAAYFQALAKWPTILERRISQKGLTKLTDDQALNI
jgi:GT2 family glycosyltransferase